MRKYTCSICGYIYDEASGDPERGIVLGTKWESVPEDWTCPLCGAMKSDFVENQISSEPALQEVSNDETNKDGISELSFGELSALCSNLSKGCEKQYKSEEAELFNKLAQYYQSKNALEGGSQLNEISTLIQLDLSSGYPQANVVASDAADRGTLRSLLWGEKVTRMANSLLSRYEKQQDSLLEDTHIYVCDICGFIYIGDNVPNICPVCKVPSFKLIEIKRG